MKIVIAMDSFKGSLNSIDCGNAVKRGILNALPDVDISVYPLADGGEGMAKTLSDSLHAEWIPVSVSGPLSVPVTAGYGYIEDSKTAVLEMASAAGLALLTPGQYNPLVTTTYGVGELILHAFQHGARHFIVGIGGSSTNDGGIGMLKALGYEFQDRNGNDVGHGANSLAKIHTIISDKVSSKLLNCTFEIACDVTNPLCGKNGATYIYGPQKGLKNEQLADIDSDMKHFADKVSNMLGKDVSEVPGTGAAGGMGFAFLSFLNGKLVPGAELILNALDIEKEMKNADLVITGEGRLDSQTVLGKAPITVAKMAKKYGKPVIAFSGCLGKDAGLCNEHGIDAFFPVLTEICTLEEALSEENAAKNLEITAEQVFRLIRLYA